MKSSRPGTIRRLFQSHASVIAHYHSVLFTQRHENSTGLSHTHDWPIISTKRTVASKCRLHGPCALKSISKARCCVKSASTTATVEILIPIWKRVLQLESVALGDNFFELGGDSSLALQLFDEIALACGRDLPPVMIYQAPTI